MIKYYALVDTTDNKIKVGPRPWNTIFWNKFLIDNNIDLPDFDQNEPSEKIIIPDSNYVIFPVILADPPDMDSFYQRPSGPYYAIGVDDIIGHYTIAEKPISEISYMIKQKATEYRYEKEIKGCEFNSIKLATDRESQSLMTGVRLKSDVDNTKTFNWKGGDGWVTIDHTAIVALSDAVMDHVESCFGLEMDVHQSVDAAETNNSGDYAATITEFKNIYADLKTIFGIDVQV